MCTNSDAGKEIMSYYIASIKTAIAPEWLLVYKLQDGWEPLCKFLDKKILKEDVPHLNDAEKMTNNENKWKKQGLDI
jgi:hypothetical protein